MDDYTVERYELTTDLKKFYENYVTYDFTELECSKCTSYDKKWTCPPFDFDVKNIWTKYDNIKLIFQKFTFTDEFKKKQLTFTEFRENSRNLFQNEKKKILQEMLEEEKRLDGLYVTCGPCNLCVECTRIIGEQCRNPNLRRYSMEALGTNVISAVNDLFNVTPQWITTESQPDYHIYMNAILY